MLLPPSHGFNSSYYIADLRAEAFLAQGPHRTRLMIPAVDVRRKLARPSKPVPSKTIVPGSGIAGGAPLCANPVIGPQFVPDAVQK